MLIGHALHRGIEPYPGCQLCMVLRRTEHSEVWHAVTVEYRHLAVKFFLPDDDNSTQRNIDLLLTVRQLSHPHLISIDWVGCYREYVAVAMELAQGSLLDLFEVFRTKFGMPIIGRQICPYLAVVADALDFLQTSNSRCIEQRMALQHGNIKPSNLLLVGGQVKVSDFNLSSQMSQERAHERLAQTLHYAAPEIFRGLVSTRSDQYALATTYCHLRGGRLPFSDTPRTLDAGYVRPEPDLTMLPEAERPIIARALASCPEDRWPACAEMMTQLSKVVCLDL